MEGREMLIVASVLCKGDFAEIMKMIRNRVVPSEEESQKAFASVKSTVTTIIDDDYPECLKHVDKPPIVLYYYGDLSLIQDRSRIAGYVGSREASPYGLEMARYFADAMVERGLVVISGMARGIDSAVQ